MSIIATHAWSRGNTPRGLSADDVSDLLAGFIAEKNTNGATPNEEQVAELTHWFNKYVTEPWDEGSVSKYRAADATARKEREALDEAAEILRRDLSEYRGLKGMRSTTVRQRIAELEIAITVLGHPRGWFEQGIPRFYKPWPGQKAVGNHGSKDCPRNACGNTSSPAHEGTRGGCCCRRSGWASRYAGR